VSREPQAQEETSDKGNHFSHVVDSFRFIARVARILATHDELKGPYEACIATFGSEEDAEKVVVSIVDTKRRLIIDRRAWIVSEYDNEASSIDQEVMDALAGDMIDYCERSQVGRISLIDEPFPTQDLHEKCPHCGQDMVRVPWQDF